MKRVSLGGAAFLKQKEGERAEDCQDAFACSVQQQVFALADGVTVSFLGGAWAWALVEGFVTEPLLNGNTEPWRQKALSRWQTVRPDLRNSRNIHVRNRVRANDPGCATFIGGQLQQGPGEAVELVLWGRGDACALLFNEGLRLERSFPLKDPAEFGFRPDYLSTEDEDFIPLLKRDTFPMRPGQTLIFASDALAKWLLQAVTRCPDRLDHLLHINDRNAFDAFIEQQRNSAECPLDNDDVAFAHLAAALGAPTVDVNLPSTSDAARSEDEPDMSRPSSVELHPWVQGIDGRVEEFGRRLNVDRARSKRSWRWVWTATALLLCLSIALGVYGYLIQRQVLKIGADLEQLRLEQLRLEIRHGHTAGASANGPSDKESGEKPQ